MLDEQKAIQSVGIDLECAHEFDISCAFCRLRSLCLPASLTREEVDLLESIVDHCRVVKSQDYLYRAGQKFNSVYAVISGAVKSYATGGDGSDCIIGFHLPGELFGFSGISRKYYVNSAQAILESRVCELPFDELETICRRVPGLQFRLLHLMSDRIVDCQDHLAQLTGTKTAQNRLAMFLLSLSSRAARRGESATHIHVPMTGQDIGNYLGISAEAVSRGFSRLARCHAIRKDGRDITLLDHSQLRHSVCHMLEVGDRK